MATKSKPPKNKFSNWARLGLFWAIIIMAALTIFAVISPRDQLKEVAISQVIQGANSGAITKIEGSGSDLKITLKGQDKPTERSFIQGGVSTLVKDNILNDIKITFREMLDLPGKVGEHLRDNEWLMAIKQRIGIPGGCCVFDLPSYHYWLNLDPAQKHSDFNKWLIPFQPVRNAFGIVLHLLRKSGKTLQVVANQGVFQQAGSEYIAHMLRLNLNDSLPCVPEISANKYALNIRFIPSQSEQKNKVYEGDVPFELTFCNL